MARLHSPVQSLERALFYAGYKNKGYWEHNVVNLTSGCSSSRQKLNIEEIHNSCQTGGQLLLQSGKKN